MGSAARHGRSPSPTSSDGLPDVAVANAGSNDVSVLLGKGDGRLSAAATFAVGAEPRSVAVGDFNSDGRPDLATADFGGDSVSILLGRGDGSFRRPVSIPAGARPAALAVGHLNGDAAPDIAVADLGSDRATILLGDGRGAFSARRTPALYSGAGKVRPSSVAVGRLNGDARPDLAFTLSRAGRVAVMCGSGRGRFRRCQAPRVGRDPYSVAVGDLGGGRAPDLVVANRASNTVSMLLGRSPRRPASPVCRGLEGPRPPQPRCRLATAARARLEEAV
ncbi:MAG: FG-GAP repeat domain-containing protein [Syntrophothermus sp.]